MVLVMDWYSFPDIFVFAVIFLCCEQPLHSCVDVARLNMIENGIEHVKRLFIGIALLIWR